LNSTHRNLSAHQISSF